MPIDDDISVGVSFSQFFLKEAVTERLPGQEKTDIVPEPMPNTEMTMGECNLDAVYFLANFFWQFEPEEPVTVALYSQGGCNGLQLCEHFAGAYISGMKDLVRLLLLDRAEERWFENFGTVTDVRIREDDDFLLT